MERLSAEDLSILVVEPSKMQRKVLLEALTKEGVDKTAVCGNKAEAIQKIREFKPDLVISSLYFEDGTGLELLRLIRAEESLEDLPLCWCPARVAESSWKSLSSQG
ncbi:response regulator [Aliamphritea spongicola]|nr:response regulator [Aliamphritea spongicola]